MQHAPALLSGKNVHFDFVKIAHSKIDYPGNLVRLKISMDLDEAIRGRRSIREYKEKSVPEELVRQVIEAATFAPSAKNGQQWRFTVLTGNAKNELTDCFRYELELLCEKIGEENTGYAFGSCSIMEKAPVVIMVWNAGEMGWETEKHSVAAAIENMLLKAYSLGLGSLWIGTSSL